MYTIKQMEQYANKFLKENYNLQLTVPLKINARLKTTCGRFKYRRYASGKRESVSVEMNKFFIENNEPTIVLDVLRHELVHFALFELGKPNADGHPVFEGELRRLKIVSQSTISQYNLVSKPKTVSIYSCASLCGQEYQTGRRLTNNGINHRCRCGGRLIDKGKKVV